MENQEEPIPINNSEAEENKRKANEEDNNNNNNNNTYDPLSLSLSPYSERRVRARPSVSFPDMPHNTTSSSPPTLFGVPLHPAPAPARLPAVYADLSPATGGVLGSAYHQHGLIREGGGGNNDEDDAKISIVPPFPWATDRPAKVHSMQHLIQNKIVSITGKVQCGSCHRKYEMSFDLVTKFREVVDFVASHVDAMHNRAPQEWKHPVLPTCEHCGADNAVKPIIGDAKDHSINWLFMFLGQLLGSCTLDHLRYFCNHNNVHRSGAKDRVLYHTYTQLMKQLLGKA